MFSNMGKKVKFLGILFFWVGLVSVLVRSIAIFIGNETLMGVYMMSGISLGGNASVNVGIEMRIMTLLSELGLVKGADETLSRIIFGVLTLVVGFVKIWGVSWLITGFGELISNTRRGGQTDRGANTYYSGAHTGGQSRGYTPGANNNGAYFSQNQQYTSRNG